MKLQKVIAVLFSLSLVTLIAVSDESENHFITVSGEKLQSEAVANLCSNQPTVINNESSVREMTEYFKKKYAELPEKTNKVVRTHFVRRGFRSFDSLPYDCQRQAVRNILKALRNSQMAILSSAGTDIIKDSMGLKGYTISANFTRPENVTTNKAELVYAQPDYVFSALPSDTRAGHTYATIPYSDKESVLITDYNNIEYLPNPWSDYILRVAHKESDSHLLFIRNIHRINLGFVHSSFEKYQYINKDARELSPCEFMKKYDLCGIYSNRVYEFTYNIGFTLTPITKGDGAGNECDGFFARNAVKLSPNELSELIYLIYKYDDAYVGYSYENALRQAPEFLLPVNTIKTNLGKMTEDTLIKKQSYHDMEVLMFYDYLNRRREKGRSCFYLTNAFKSGNFDFIVTLVNSVLADMGMDSGVCNITKQLFDDIRKNPLKASPLFSEAFNEYYSSHHPDKPNPYKNNENRYKGAIWGKECFYRAQSTPIADKGYYVSKLRFDEKDQLRLFHEISTNSTLPLVELQEISNEIVAGRYRGGGLKAVAKAMLGFDMRVTFDSSVNFLVNGKEKSIPFVIEEYEKTRNNLEKKCLLWTIYKIGILNNETETFLTAEINKQASSDYTNELADYAAAVLTRLRQSPCKTTSIRPINNYTPRKF